MVAIPAILFKNHFKGEKIWWLFAQLFKNPTDCFVLEVLAVTTLRVDFKIESALLKVRRKKIKCYILMNKWEQLQLTLNDSKSEEGDGDYLDI